MLNNQSHSLHTSHISVKHLHTQDQLDKSCDQSQLTESCDVSGSQSNSQDIQAMMKTNVYDIYDKIKTIRLSLESMDSSLSQNKNSSIASPAASEFTPQIKRLSLRDSPATECHTTAQSDGQRLKLGESHVPLTSGEAMPGPASHHRLGGSHTPPEKDWSGSRTVGKPGAQQRVIHTGVGGHTEVRGHTISPLTRSDTYCVSKPLSKSADNLLVSPDLALPAPASGGSSDRYTMTQSSQSIHHSKSNHSHSNGKPPNRVTSGAQPSANHSKGNNDQPSNQNRYSSSTFHVYQDIESVRGDNFNSKPPSDHQKKDRRPLETRNNGVDQAPQTGSFKHCGPLPTTKAPPKPARLMTVSHEKLRDTHSQQGPATYMPAYQPDPVTFRTTLHADNKSKRRSGGLPHSKTDPTLQRQMIFWPVGSTDGRLVSRSRDSLNSVRFELELEQRLERLVSESGPDQTEC